MKTKCMSCEGPTKKLQAGSLPKKQNGGFPNMKKIVNTKSPGYHYAFPKKKVNPVKKAISTIKKTISNIGKPKPKIAPQKYELGGSLPKAQFGGQRRARQQGSLPSRSSCGEKIKRRKKSWARQDKAAKILKPIGTAAGVIGGIGLAGAAAYKKSTPFKNAVDELKGKLGFNQKGGIVKKYQNGGPTDSLKVIKKEGKLAVKTEKQKQAAAKKAAALAKKIAKAKENARLNLEWEKMSESQKDSVIRQQRSRF